MKPSIYCLIKQTMAATVLGVIFTLTVGIGLKGILFATIEGITNATPDNNLGLVVTIPTTFFFYNIVLPKFYRLCSDGKIPGLSNG